MPEHAIAEIAQIRCTRAEIVILGRFIRCDFRIDRSIPSPVGGLAAGNPRKRRRRKIVIFEQRDLERKNGFRLGVPCVTREQAESRLRSRERIDERLMVLRGGPILTGFML
jgi:hypothetical protein